MGYVPAVMNVGRCYIHKQNQVIYQCNVTLNILKCGLLRSLQHALRGLI